MSNRHFPEPSQIDYHADLAQQHVEQARKRLTVSDVLAQIDDLVASEPDETRHHLYGLTAWLLDHTLACHGGDLFDRCKALVLTAIDRCVADALAQED